MSSDETFSTSSLSANSSIIIIISLGHLSSAELLITRLSFTRVRMWYTMELSGEKLWGIFSILSRQRATSTLAQVLSTSTWSLITIIEIAIKKIKSPHSFAASAPRANHRLILSSPTRWEAARMPPSVAHRRYNARAQALNNTHDFINFSFPPHPQKRSPHSVRFMPF